MAKIMLVTAAASCGLMAATTNRVRTLKVTASWNIPMTEEAIHSAVTGAKDLGFNAYAWTSTSLEEFFLAQCKMNGIKAFKVLEPLRKRAGARLQVLGAEERLLPGYAGRIGDDYQYGGEPLPGRREVLNMELVCPLDAGILNYVTREVARARRLGFDGVCWDFVGYRNYHSCECGVCRRELNAFMKIKNSNQIPKELNTAFYEKTLADLYVRIFDATRQTAPEFTVLCHCHPVFLSDTSFPRRVKVDYCGATVSWFFQPHWSMEKVRDLSRRTVQCPYDFRFTIGMPMIGCYTSGPMARHRRGGARLRAEFDALREVGARSVMVCELGDILADPETRSAIKSGLEQIR